MTTTSTSASKPGGARVAVQRFGTFLSGMIMPLIPALIAWGIFTAFFIDVGWTPVPALATIVGPFIHYLLPILIAYLGGHLVYSVRGGVVGAIATFGVIAGSDWLIAGINAALPADNQLGEINMFIGAMIMAPMAAWTMKQLDKLWDGKVKAGFEMLVNMFSAGIWGFAMAILGFYPLAWLINGLMDVLSTAVNWLIETNLLPLTSILIEPAKVLFLNNAINHGVLTPLGIQQASSSDTGGSILFLLEANPGPGVGLLLAFTFFGIGAARASAPGAAIIQFFGGIHEVYFPYALMKPTLILALIAGGMTGVTTNLLLGGLLRGPAAPGSIIAVEAQVANNSYFAVTLSVILAAAVTFVVASVILRASRKRDLLAEGDAFGAAVSQTAANKGKSSAALDALRASDGKDRAVVREAQDAVDRLEEEEETGGALDGGQVLITKRVENIVFACDAGMGSSAMGASVLRNKIKKAGVEGVSVTNKAIANLDGTADLIITQNQLTDRARRQSPDAVHVSVDNFMNSPKYDEVVDLVVDQQKDGQQG
ncbi:PTS mannitol transporter subunit IICB [Microbacterium sp. 18062]|uniref:PTS mannitol transporter subunit IICB n=1 Tax=Microbacterium sp. 18062 TaxID=2681410 RepID=UPI00135C2406|nr:PTS mannitol transporter subunit IICB [Microbacterium sp. 18062]